MGRWQVSFAMLFSVFTGFDTPLHLPLFIEETHTGTCAQGRNRRCRARNRKKGQTASADYGWFSSRQRQKQRAAGRGEISTYTLPPLNSFIRSLDG